MSKCVGLISFPNFPGFVTSGKQLVGHLQWVSSGGLMALMITS